VQLGDRLVRDSSPVRPVVEPAERSRTRDALAVVAFLTVVIVAGFAIQHVVQPDFPVSPVPLDQLAGLRMKALDGDWRGPQLVEETPGTPGTSDARMYAAVFGRGSAHGTVRDFVLVGRITPRSPDDGFRPVAEMVDLYQDAGTLTRFKAMTVKSLDCHISPAYRPVEAIVCEAVGTWGHHPIEIRQIDWVEPGGELLTVVGFTYGTRKDISATVDATARSLQAVEDFGPARGRP
jgi:hypothetical protein